jgi:hypothetical protein
MDAPPRLVHGCLWRLQASRCGRSREDSAVDLALALPPVGKHDWAMGNYFAHESKWKRQLEAIVGRDVSIAPLSAILGNRR